jgi:arsenate reductase
MKQRVLFVCVGNACRSQMAEAFARAYGLDVMEASSGGLSPGAIVDPYTKAVMAERGLDLERHFPKTIEEALRGEPSLIVNMSGAPMPAAAAGIALEAWTVRDPIGEAAAIHREVRDLIEERVMQLVLRLRQRKPRAEEPPRYKFGRMG